MNRGLAAATKGDKCPEDELRRVGDGPCPGDSLRRRQLEAAGDEPTTQQQPRSHVTVVRRHLQNTKPEAFLLSFTWPFIDAVTSPAHIHTVFSLIRPQLDLSRIFDNKQLAEEQVKQALLYGNSEFDPESEDFLELLDVETRQYLQQAGDLPLMVLRGIICFYHGFHYVCFFYDCDMEAWFLYDDDRVKNVGAWENVAFECMSGHNYPTMVLYETATNPSNAQSGDDRSTAASTMDSIKPCIMSPNGIPRPTDNVVAPCNSRQSSSPVSSQNNQLAVATLRTNDGQQVGINGPSDDARRNHQEYFGDRSDTTDGVKSTDAVGALYPALSDTNTKEQLEMQRRKEEELSLRLIQQMQDEARTERDLIADADYAQKLQDEINAQDAEGPVDRQANHTVDELQAGSKPCTGRGYLASKDPNCPHCGASCAPHMLTTHVHQCKANPVNMTQEFCVYCEASCAPGQLENHLAVCKLNPSNVDANPNAGFRPEAQTEHQCRWCDRLFISWAEWNAHQNGGGCSRAPQSVCK